MRDRREWDVREMIQAAGCSPEPVGRVRNPRGTRTARPFPSSAFESAETPLRSMRLPSDRSDCRHRPPGSGIGPGADSRVNGTSSVVGRRPSGVTGSPIRGMSSWRKPSPLRGAGSNAGGGSGSRSVGRGRSLGGWRVGPAGKMQSIKPTSGRLLHPTAHASSGRHINRTNRGMNRPQCVGGDSRRPTGGQVRFPSLVTPAWQWTRRQSQASDAGVRS